MNKKILAIVLVLTLLVSTTFIIINADEIAEVLSKLTINLDPAAKATLITGDANTTFQGTKATELMCNNELCKFTLYKEGVINKDLSFPAYYTEPILVNVTNTQIIEHVNQTEAGIDPETNETLYEYVYWNETVKTTTQEQNGSRVIQYTDQELITKQQELITETLNKIAEAKASRIAGDYLEKNEAKELVI